ncbi:hypothetical protein D3C78_1839960 [compost metagenome]
MVERFCGLPTKPMDFPLKHPSSFLVDEKFELSVARLICDPRFFSVRSILSRVARRVFRIKKTESVLGFLKNNFLAGKWR